MKKIISILALIGAMTFVVACSNSSSKEDTPSEVTAAFLESIKTLDPNKVLEYIHPSSILPTDSSGWAEFFKNVVYDSDFLVDYRIIDETLSEDGNFAAVRYSSSFASSEAEEGSATLRKTPDGWKVLRMD